MTILNTVNTRLPFLPADEKMDVKEEVRLKTRVLDLRYTAFLAADTLDIMYHINTIWLG